MKRVCFFVPIVIISLTQLQAQFKPLKPAVSKQDSLRAVKRVNSTKNINPDSGSRAFALKNNKTITDAFKTIPQQKITLLTGAFINEDFDNKNARPVFVGSVTQSYENAGYWEKDFLWKNIPGAAAYGLYEISELPFPLDNKTSFNGVVMSGLVEHNNREDAVVFHIKYKDPALSNINTATAKPIIATNNSKRFSPVQPVHPANDNVLNRASSVFKNNNQVKLNSVIEEGSTKYYTGNKSVLAAISNMGKYYIRITPLDINKRIIDEPGNTVQLLYKPPYFAKPVPSPAQTLRDDYTITGFNYIPAHFEEAGYMACVRVSGYNEAVVNGNSFYQQFKNAYPIGKVICPEPPQDKSWYEKGFSGVTGMVSKMVSGAANIAGDCKNYVSNVVDVVLTPVYALKNITAEQATVLKQKVLASVDASLDAAGLNPHLSNYDEMLMKTKNQILLAVSQTVNDAMDIPLETKNQLLQNLEQGFNDMLKQSSQTNYVNGGFLHFTPDPRGQFQNPYVEIEITRTGNNYKDNPLFTYTTLYQSASKTIGDWSKAKMSNYTKTITASLYQDASFAIPYLSNVGDKIKMIIVLTPRILYLHHNKIGYEKDEITKVDESAYEYESEWHDTNYAGLPGRYSPGFQLLYPGSENSFGINAVKVAPGVKLKWNNN